MKRISLLSIMLIVLFLGSCQIGKSQETTNEKEVEIKVQSGNSLTHKNLTIFLIRGKDKVSRNYITLQEAMENKNIVLHETSNVGELSVDNKSDKYIFILSGDIVKGGKQDRTIAEDVILKPGCKNIPLKSFCVEQSRWRQRGSESASQFSSSGKMLSNKNLKIAAREKKEQSAVWSEVSNFQSKAGANVNADIKSRESATSLQLTLENKDLQSVVKEYIKAMEPLFTGKDDILGFGFCVNGKISTIDAFGNAALFAKLKSKLLESAANEAVFQYNDKLVFEDPSVTDIQSFIDTAKKGKETVRNTGENTIEKKYVTEKSILFCTFNSGASTQPVHITIYNSEDVNLQTGSPTINNQQIYQYGGINRRN